MEQENLSSRYCCGRSIGPWPPGRREGGPKWRHRKGQSTDAGHRGGPARSSDEGPVMGLEPRGRADQGNLEANPSGEEPRRTEAEGEVV